MYVVVIRTAGNQRYIFSSGKRQEIVGASALIVKVEGEWATAALEREFQGFERETWRIDTHDAELLVAGAGQIVLLVKDKAAGLRLVTEVTVRAVRQAPGLDVCGMVVEYAEGELATAVRRAQTELSSVREARPGPQARFLRLPIVADCSSTGLPAAEVRSEAGAPGDKEPEERPQARSAVSVAKLAAHEEALLRLATIAKTDRQTMRKTVHWLGFEADWVAVVHADGNGIGKIFHGLHERTAGRDGRLYANALREVSTGLDECAQRAFEEAKQLIGDAARILPLVVGGDDLTILCDAKSALPFTRHYLDAFERETARDHRLTEWVPGGLGAAAGVAIVKRNYPFHFAYKLAEDLIDEEAKRVKEWASALAFVVLHESAAPDRKRIRSAVPLPGGYSGSASPYVVGKGSGDPRAYGRRWEDLERRVAALNRHEPGAERPLIARGAAHDLREGLCLGEEVAASRVELLRRRFKGDKERTEALTDLTKEECALVWTERGAAERKVTGLLDAMAVLPFLSEREVAR